MMKIGKNIVKNYMTLKYQFSGARLQETVITPVDWELEIKIASLERKNKNKSDLTDNVDISYQKIYFWLDTNLPKCIMVNATDPDDLYISNLIGNVVMHCPGNPGDDLIVQLLHSKLYVLSGPDLFIGEISLFGSDLSIKYTFDTQHNVYLLPESTKDYFGDIGVIAKENTPWWARDDGFCFDFLKPADSDIPDEEIYKNIVDPMDEFYNIISELSSENKTSLSEEPAKIIRLDKWKPKKV